MKNDFTEIIGMVLEPFFSGVKNEWERLFVSSQVQCTYETALQRSPSIRNLRLVNSGESASHLRD